MAKWRASSSTCSHKCRWILKAHASLCRGGATREHRRADASAPRTAARGPRRSPQRGGARTSAAGSFSLSMTLPSSALDIRRTTSLLDRALGPRWSAAADASSPAAAPPVGASASPAARTLLVRRIPCHRAAGAAVGACGAAGACGVAGACSAWWPSICDCAAAAEANNVSWSGWRAWRRWRLQLTSGNVSATNLIL